MCVRVSRQQIQIVLVKSIFVKCHREEKEAERTDPLCNLYKLFNVSLDIVLKALESFATIHCQLAQLVGKSFFVVQVDDAHAIASSFGGISWTNTSFGGANLFTCMGQLWSCQAWITA